MQKGTIIFRSNLHISNKYPVLPKLGDIPVEAAVKNNSGLAVNYQVMKIYRSEEPPEKFPGVVFTRRISKVLWQTGY